MGGLCTLADTKLILDIPSATTTYDSKLTLFINRVTSLCVKYLGFPAHYTSYTSELYTVNNSQLLYLRTKPIQTVTTVTLNGTVITNTTGISGGDSGYSLTPEDALAGRLYRGAGWTGNWFTREMTYDYFSGVREIKITYTGGWKYPDDTGYVLADAQDEGNGVKLSLPYGISEACSYEVVEIFRRNQAHAEGLTSYSEGPVSWSWNKQRGKIIPDSTGLSETCQGILNSYRRWGIG